MPILSSNGTAMRRVETNQNGVITGMRTVDVRNSVTGAVTRVFTSLDISSDNGNFEWLGGGFDGDAFSVDFSILDENEMPLNPSWYELHVTAMGRRIYGGQYIYFDFIASRYNTSSSNSWYYNIFNDTLAQLYFWGVGNVSNLEITGVQI